MPTNIQSAPIYGLAIRRFDSPWIAGPWWVASEELWSHLGGVLRHTEVVRHISTIQKTCQSLLRCTSGLVIKLQVKFRRLWQDMCGLSAPKNTSRHDWKSLLIISRGPKPVGFIIYGFKHVWRSGNRLSADTENQLYIGWSNHLLEAFWLIIVSQVLGPITHSIPTTVYTAVPLILRV